MLDRMPFQEHHQLLPSELFRTGLFACAIVAFSLGKFTSAQQPLQFPAQPFIDVEEAPVDPLGIPAPFHQHVKGRVAVDCALARRICELTEEQEQQLSSINNEWLTRTYTDTRRRDAKIGMVQAVGQVLGVRQLRAIPAENPVDSIPKVLSAIDAKVESILEPDQAKLFRTELDARERFRREADASVMVAIFERDVLITAQQRAALIQAVADDLKTNLAWRIYVLNEHIPPPIAASIVEDILNDRQLAQRAKSGPRTNSAVFLNDLQHLQEQNLNDVEHIEK